MMYILLKINSLFIMIIIIDHEFSSVGTTVVEWKFTTSEIACMFYTR
jgi:hypothetical protein